MSCLHWNPGHSVVNVDCFIYHWATRQLIDWVQAMICVYTHEDKASQPTQCKYLPHIILRIYTKHVYCRNTQNNDACDCYVNTVRIVINQGSQSIASNFYWIAVFVGSVWMQPWLKTGPLSNIWCFRSVQSSKNQARRGSTISILAFSLLFHTITFERSILWKSPFSESSLCSTEVVGITF